MQKITPFLWFNGQAEEAACFYTALFPGSHITSVTRYGKDAQMPEGTVMTVAFTIMGMAFVGLNGGPHYQFTPAVSYAVSCQDQEEIDRYWTALADGGKELGCGWVEDRYGLSWQVIPHNLGTLMTHPDEPGRVRLMEAMGKMKKLEIKVLEAAFNGH